MNTWVVCYCFCLYLKGVVGYLTLRLLGYETVKCRENMVVVDPTHSHRNKMLNPNRRSSARSSEERCKARRRRRIQMRRNGVSLSRRSPRPGRGLVVRDVVRDIPNRGGVFRRRLMVNSVPMVGAVAVAGRQREMEDAVTVKTNLCSPVINHRRPVHFFGVYDGHGGAHFSTICKETMHAMLKEELMRERYNLLPSLNSGSNSDAAPPAGDESVLQEKWKEIFTRSFIRTEMVAFETCECGSKGFRCSCDRTPIFFAGSTAVVVVLTDEHIAVANCGDSRAVLGRGGRVVPLSFDHKPDRADEKARIELCGGHVVNVDTPRVEGILAMSRAIGDNYLKPMVTSEPEVSFTRRVEGDEFVILASDGLWDVMSSEMACHVTRECLSDPVGPDEAVEGPGGTTVPSKSATAANLLTRLALARQSCDNVSVVVVDLMNTNA